MAVGLNRLQSKTQLLFIQNGFIISHLNLHKNEIYVQDDNTPYVSKQSKTHHEYIL